MKLIKAIITKNRALTETSFTYPEKWDPTKINILAYEDTDNLGDVEEFCIGIIHDDAYALSLIDNIAVIEIDETEANTLGDAQKPQRLFVDDNKLAEILIAIDKDKAVCTQAELDMLNPDNDAPGIRKTAKFDVSNWYIG